MKITLNSGEELFAKAVVVATDWNTASRLTKQAVPILKSRSTTCLYFAAKQAPVPEPMLVLNGTGRGLVNNICVPSNVAPLYAPDEAESLVSVSILGIPQTDDETLLAAVRKECGEWFGAAEVKEWRHLRTYRVEHALPDQTPPALSPPERPIQLSRSLYVAGDHRDTASIQGAMVSGRRAAEAIAASL
jgi:hypothetical protein